MFQKTLFVALLPISILLSGCNKEDKVAKQAEVDRAIIERYIADNGLNVTEVSDGVFVEITNETNGGFANSNSSVTCAYKGYLTDGKVFDESTTGITFGLNQVIRGWQIGIPEIPEGGSGILLIPSGKAYGTESVGSIPANSVLVFEVDLIEVLN